MRRSSLSTIGWSCLWTTKRRREDHEADACAHAGVTTARKGDQMNPNVATDAGPSLRRAMYRLWVDHVMWTCEYVVSAIDGAADAEPAARRLLKNQEDIGNAIAGFYGEKAGAGLTDLLKQHIL